MDVHSVHTQQNTSPLQISIWNEMIPVSRKSILSVVPEIGTRYRKLFCRLQVDSRATATKCLPDSLGILLAHQYVAQQLMMELVLMDDAYDWYTINPLQYLYFGNMEQLSSFSRHIIHIGHSEVDIAQTIQP